MIAIIPKTDDAPRPIEVVYRASINGLLGPVQVMWDDLTESPLYCLQDVLSELLGPSQGYKYASCKALASMEEVCSRPIKYFALTSKDSNGNEDEFLYRLIDEQQLSFLLSAFCSKSRIAWGSTLCKHFFSEVIPKARNIQIEHAACDYCQDFDAIDDIEITDEELVPISAVNEAKATAYKALYSAMSPLIERVTNASMEALLACPDDEIMQQMARDVLALKRCYKEHSAAACQSTVVDMGLDSQMQ